MPHSSRRIIAKGTVTLDVAVVRKSLEGAGCESSRVLRMRVCASGEEDKWLRLCRILTALTIAAQLQRINRCVALPLLSIYLRDRGDFNVICFSFVELFFFLPFDRREVHDTTLSYFISPSRSFFFSSVACVVNAYKVAKSFLFFFSLGQRALNLLAYCSHAHRGKKKKTRARLAFCY